MRCLNPGSRFGRFKLMAINDGSNMFEWWIYGLSSGEMCHKRGHSLFLIGKPSNYINGSFSIAM